MSEQPEALRLANELEMWTQGEPGSVELRRQHAEIERLTAVIEDQRRIIAVLNAGIGCETTLESIGVLDERDELRAKLAALEKQDILAALKQMHPDKPSSQGEDK